MAKTDSEKWIDKINDARRAGYLSQKETVELRNLAKPVDQSPTGLANKKGELGPKDREKLNKLFNSYLNNKGKTELGVKPSPTKPTTPPPPPVTTTTPETPIGDIPDAPEAPNTADTSEEPPPPDDVSTTRAGKKTTTIKIPGANERADIAYPDDADPVNMPNIANKIKKEIDRITMSLVKSTREFLEAGIDFDAVNQVPDYSEFVGDNVLYEDPIFMNQPDDNSERGVATDIMYMVSDELNDTFSISKPENSNYNYIDYLELFDLDYKSDGAPVFTLKIEIDNAIIEDLEYKILKTDANGISTVVAEGS